MKRLHREQGSLKNLSRIIEIVNTQQGVHKIIVLHGMEYTPLGLVLYELSCDNPGAMMYQGVVNGDVRFSETGFSLLKYIPSLLALGANPKHPSVVRVFERILGAQPDTFFQNISAMIQAHQGTKKARRQGSTHYKEFLLTRLSENLSDSKSQLSNARLTSSGDSQLRLSNSRFTSSGVFSRSTKAEENSSEETSKDSQESNKLTTEPKDSDNPANQCGCAIS